jgi:hypothetical protein
MILIEGKLFESKIFESKYPDCNVEIILSPIRPGLGYAEITSEQIDKFQKLLEMCREQSIRIDTIIKQYGHTIPKKTI